MQPCSFNDGFIPGNLIHSVPGSACPSSSGIRADNTPFKRAENSASEASRQIDDALVELRGRGRCAVHILDVGCGCGEWLVRTALRAASLGFVAIEARGFDVHPDSIERARSIVRDLRDPRIGIFFDIADVPTGLTDEEDHGADLILCHQAAEDLGSLVADSLPELCRVAAGPLVQVELRQ